MVSWVAIDRVVERERASNPAYRKKTAGRPLRSDARQLADTELIERLQSFGIEMDPATLGRLCADSLSAEELAGPLIERYVAEMKPRGFESDWIWICLSSLWERWFPDKPSFEGLDDKMQAGYELRDSGDAAATCRVWLGAWNDVLQIFDKAGIESIGEFDYLFNGTEAIYNWIQDLEDELLNAGLKDRIFLAERVAVCEEGLKRFEENGDLTTENRRRYLAESYFEMGETRKADTLFQEWLKADPHWGFGWIGWSDCYRFTRNGQLDMNRAEELLREGLAIPEVRDRRDLVDRLSGLYEELGRSDEAAAVERHADSIRTTHEIDRERHLMRHKTTMIFGGDGLPIDELPKAGDGLRKLVSGRAVAGRKVGRNQPCPCGSGKKFKKCCGVS
jgi:tetratricopeptide (TPR) repeat protein